MRHVLIAAAAIAFGGLVTTAAIAQQSSPPYVAGGPVQIGSWCQVNTDAGSNDNYGYFQPCTKR